MDSYQESERYFSNNSPGPIGTSCCKTPEVQPYVFNSHYMINQMYPTPPSDSDEGINSSFKKQTKQGTPIINQYYSENYMNSDRLCRNSSYQNLVNSNEQLHHEHSNENTSSVQISNRYKRRSRTTYSKTQVREN
jgi:hypothetical protein